MSDNSSAEDFKWLRGIQQNDEKALVYLMRKYYADLFDYASKFASNEEVLKKCIREVFETLWKERHAADQILSPRMYFFKSARYKLQQASISVQPLISRALTGDEKECDSYRQVENGKGTKSNPRYDLSKNEQEVVYLRYCQRLENGDIAELMNMSQHSVCQLQLFALEKLIVNKYQIPSHV